MSRESRAAGAELRTLGPSDRAEAVALAVEAFRGNGFYRQALGLSDEAFPAYWDALLKLLVESRDARAFGLFQGGRLEGMILAAYHRFPSPLPAARFLLRLLRGLGPFRLWGYLRFVRAYDRALDRASRDAATEARCLWLMVSPTARMRLGPALVREVRAALYKEGKTLGLGLIDAGDPRIDAFYRRLGFRVSYPFPFRRRSAATIETRTSSTALAREWRVTVHPSVSAIEPSRWDALGTDPLSRHAVLRALERARLPGLRLRALTVEDATGRWVAAAPLTTLSIDAVKLTRGPFRAAIRIARRVAPGFMRSTLLLCGTPLSVGNPPALMGAGTSHRRAYGELERAVREIARGERISWCAFKEFPGSERREALEGLGPGWTLAPSEPSSIVPIRWASYEGYLEGLRGHYRYKIRLAARKLARAGIEVDTVPLRDGYDDLAHALYESVFARAPVQLEHLNAAFFQALGEAYPETASLVRFRRAGRLVGWVALLESEGAIHDLFHGIDYGELGASSLYFNQLAEAIRFAIHRKARALVLGQSSEVVKSRFGARAEPLWIAVRHRSAVVNRLLGAWGAWLFPPKEAPRRRVFVSGSAG